MVSNRVRIVLWRAFFNILFEYSARGLNALAQRPLFFLFIFGIYLTCFAMFEDLVVRHNLRDHQIMIMGFSYGFIPEALLTGNIFNKTTYFGILFLGVNVGTVLFINFFA